MREKKDKESSPQKAGDKGRKPFLKAKNKA
jgi:hypothetical protein